MSSPRWKFSTGNSHGPFASSSFLVHHLKSTWTCKSRADGRASGKLGIRTVIDLPRLILETVSTTARKK